MVALDLNRPLILAIRQEETVRGRHPPTCVPYQSHFLNLKSVSRNGNRIGKIRAFAAVFWTLRLSSRLDLRVLPPMMPALNLSA
jgi:hypothetical protein